MTANPNKGRRLNIGRMCLRAWQLAGQGTEYTSELDAAQGAFARDCLELMLDDLQNDGLMLRAVNFEVLPVTAAESLYALPTDIIGTVGRAMWIPAGEDPDAGGSGELVIEPIPRQEWQTISAKSSLSTPTRYFSYVAGDSVMVHFWPIPDASGYARFQVHRMLGDNDDANATVDLDQGANAWAVWELAHYIAVAKTMPVQTCSYLAARAKEKRASVKVANAETVGFTVEISHRTQWSY